MRPPRFSRASSLAVAIAALLGTQAVQADITWSGGSTADGNWSTTGNWSGGVAPGTTNIAVFSSAIINDWGSTDTPIIIDNNVDGQAVGGFTFTGAAGSYTITGGLDNNSILLDADGTVQIDNLLSSTNTTARISAPIVLGTSATFSNYSLSGIVAGAGRLQLDTVTGGGTLSLAGTNTNANTIGNLAGAVAVTKSGVGTWVVEGGSYTGTLTIQEGTLMIPTINGNNAPGTLGSSGSAVTLGSTGDVTGTLEYYGTSNSSTKKFALAPAGNGRFQVDLSTTVLTLSGLINGGGDFIKAGDGTLVLSGTNAYEGTTTLSGGILQASKAEIAGTSGPFGKNTASGSIIFDGGTLQYSTANTYDYSPRLTTIGNKDYRIDTNGTDRTFATGLSNPGGASTSGLLKAGAGTLTLTAGSSYVGLTTIQGGTLKSAISNAIRSGNAVTVNEATAGKTSALDLNGYAQTIGGAGLTLGGYTTTSTSQVIGTGAGSVLTLSGGSTALTYSAANNPLGAIISVTTLDLNGATQTFTVGNSTSAVNDLSISSVIQNGALTKADAGTMTLTGTNAYAGDTTISSGVLQIGDNTATGSLNSASAIVNNATLTFKRADALSQSNGISGSGNVIQAGGGTTTLSGTNSYTGKTSIQAGALSIDSIQSVSGGNSAVGAPTNSTNGTIAIGSSTTAAKLTYTGGVQTTDRVIDLAGSTGGATIDQSGSGLLKFSSALTASVAGAKTLTLQGSTSGSGEMAGAIVDSSSGATALTKAGTGTWTLSGTNTYTGATTINSGGTLQLGAGSTSGKLATSSAIVDNGTLKFNRSDTLTQGSDFNSVISGTGNVVQAGGTVVLNGTNTYSGGTTVNAGGTLKVNNNPLTGSGTGSGAVTIDSGATLMGTGKLGGNVTINGIHAPGNSPGIETVGGDLTYGSTSIFEWELGSSTQTQSGTSPSAFDQVAMSSGKTLTIVDGAKINLIFNSAASGDFLGSTVKFSDIFWSSSHTWEIFPGHGTVTGNFTIDSISTDSASAAYTSASYPPLGGRFTTSGSTVTWSAVPEPSSALAGLLLAAGLLRRRR